MDTGFFLAMYGRLAAGASLLDWLEALAVFMPFVLFLEAPVYTLEILGILIHWAEGDRFASVRIRPRVSCIVTCYAEGSSVRRTLLSLHEQLYDGVMEIIAVIDGADRNRETLEAVRSLKPFFRGNPKRILHVVPKWQRGGRVSSLNTGLTFATGSVVMALDGDTDFDNDMVAKAVRYFADPDIMAVSGALRVRNAGRSLCTRLQALEYAISIHAGKTGLTPFNVVNNISGAFGIFRASMLRQAGGWDSGTAEDLDITLRLKAYMGAHPNLRIVFAPEVIAHTDVPETFRTFFKQRLRWDGDLAYLYLRKHWRLFQSGLMGFRNLLMQIWTGLVFQLLLPFFIVGYTILLSVTLPVFVFFKVMALIYAVYFCITLVFFLLFLVFISERKRQDFELMLYIPLFPIFTFFTRVNSSFSCLWELVGRSHLDSSMAPWWVLRKNNF